MIHESTGWKSKLLAAGLVVHAILIGNVLSKPGNDQIDFYIYRAGASLALEGKSPYDTPLIQLQVAQIAPPKNENDVALNCGFFLPPQAIAIFYPFAKLKWSVAEILWPCLLTLMGIACGTLAWTFGRSLAQQGTGWAIIVLALLLNPITQPAFVVGQTGLLFVGCIALGQTCFENNCPRFGCFLWAIPFFKPHLALPFLVLAWILGGWKRAAGIAVCVAILNLLGGLICRGKLDGAVSLFREYLFYLESAHKTVKYNLVAENFQITSWNRIIAALGGPAVDLKITMVLAGYALWAGLVYCRLRVSGQRPEPAFLLAATCVGALFFAQVLASEMILLVLLAPLILQHWDANRRGDFWVLIGLLLFLLVPLNLMDRVADYLQLDEESRGRTLMRSHKCFGMAALALYLLIRGNSAGGVAPNATPLAAL